MRFASLGSGSEGNALVVEAKSGVRTTRLLVDCGFSVRECERRLERLGLRIDALDAVLITHEHGDHIGSAFRVAKRAKAPVFLTYGTMAALPPLLVDRRSARIIDSHRGFECFGVEVEPFPVPHDAREPVQFVIDDGHRRLGLLTDLGHATPLLRKSLRALSALVLECNHDSAMLAGSAYPESLKRRIAGQYGHLSNDAAAAILGAIDHARLQAVVAAHLSEQNNRPELAQLALSAVLGGAPDEIRVARQHDGIGWTTLR